MTQSLKGQSDKLRTEGRARSTPNESRYKHAHSVPPSTWHKTLRERERGGGGGGMTTVIAIFVNGKQHRMFAL